MSNPNISATVTAANITDITTKKDDIFAILFFLVNLTPEQRQKLRKMSTKREGYVSAVYQAALNYSGAIPSDFDMAEFTKDINLMTAMKTVKELLAPLFEGIDDTILLLSNELMKQSDSCYGFLQTAAKGNTALTNTVNQIGTAFAGQGRKKNATVIGIPAAGSIGQAKVNTKNRFINSGATVLKVVKTGLTMAQAITVSPQGSVKLDSKWTNITIFNNSTTDDGECTISIKP